MALRHVKLLATAGRWTVPNLKQFRETRQPIVWLLAPLIGLATGAAAILFRLAIGAFQWPWLHDMSEAVARAAREQPWWVIVLAPAAGGLLVGLMLQYLLTAKRTGAVPDVMEARVNAGRGLSLNQGLAERAGERAVARRRRQRRSRGADRASRRQHRRIGLHQLSTCPMPRAAPCSPQAQPARWPPRSTRRSPACCSPRR